MGAANSTRKLTVETIALLEMLEPNATERTNKARLSRRLETALHRRWPTCRVLPFGSSASGLDFGGSDVDLGIFFDEIDADAHEQFELSERIEILQEVCLHLEAQFHVVEFVRNARVPVLKLVDRETGIACDLCIGSAHVLMNTALLKYCGEMDPRVRPLAFAIKYWAKERGISDSVNGTLSSYGYALLLLFYLQAARNLLPPVSRVFRSVHASTTVVNLNRMLASLPHIELQPTFGSSDQESVGALLCGFFRFYACEFDFEQDVVCVRHGAVLDKQTAWPHPIDWRMSIQDPFEQTHDVGRVIFARKAQDLIAHEFRRAFEMLSAGHPFHDVYARDETAWNWRATCYICDAADHKARQCPCERSDHERATDCKAKTTTSVDCWYCGASGHVKATCPLYAFLRIPCADAASTSRRSCISTPIPISPSNTNRQASAQHPIARELALASRSSSKKKKRPRYGSISSAASSPEQERSRKYMLAARRLHGRRKHSRELPSVPTAA